MRLHKHGSFCFCSSFSAFFTFKGMAYVCYLRAGLPGDSRARSLESKLRWGCSVAGAARAVADAALVVPLLVVPCD